jgi:cell division initiation protein
MALTPVEIRHITLGRAFLGYGRSHVDKLLEDIVTSFEQVWRERADLADKVENLEQELVRHRELETLLRTTLVSAERAAAELKEHARRESELVVTEAHAEARKITRDAVGDLDRMRAEARRIRSLLGAALATLDEGENGADEAEADTAAGEARAA